MFCIRCQQNKEKERKEKEKEKEREFLPVACTTKEGDHDSESVEEPDRGVEYGYGDDNRQHLLHVGYLVKE